MVRHPVILRLKFLALILGVAISGGCGRPTGRPSAGENQDPNRVLAKIGNEDFTAAQFEVFLRERFPESTSPIPRNDSLLSELLDRAIDERLLLEAARQHHVTASDQDVQEFLANGALMQG